MEQGDKLLKELEVYVRKLFSEEIDEAYSFHNLEHTLEVVAATEDIAKGVGVSESDYYCLLIAAWFHDTGYVKSIEDHEKHSVSIATAYLKDQMLPEGWLAIIIQCIMATKKSHEPETILEEVIRDADMHHLGTDVFLKRLLALRREWDALWNRRFSDREWWDMNVEFLGMHRYYTDYARKKYRAKKVMHMEMVENMAKVHAADKVESKKSGKKKKKANGGSERGVETMFRVTLRNHIQLSAIADNKSNIMLSINAIIISVVLAELVSKVDKHSYLLIPTTILLLTCVIAVVFATIATIPKITRGNLSVDDINNKKGNLMFFGNFYNMSLDDYTYGVKELMKDKDYLYSTMIRDLYFLGKVLNKKYKYLRFCYLVFVAGLLISVMSFVVSFYQLNQMSA